MVVILTSRVRHSFYNKSPTLEQEGVLAYTETFQYKVDIRASHIENVEVWLCLNSRGSRSIGPHCWNSLLDHPQHNLWMKRNIFPSSIKHERTQCTANISSHGAWKLYYILVTAEKDSKCNKNSSLSTIKSKTNGQLRR